MKSINMIGMAIATYFLIEVLVVFLTGETLISKVLNTFFFQAIGL